MFWMDTPQRKISDGGDFQRAKLHGPAPAAGDIRPSKLMDWMKVLMPPEELERPSILFWHAFLTHLPANICSHCCPTPGV